MGHVPRSPQPSCLAVFSGKSLLPNLLCNVLPSPFTCLPLSLLNPHSLCHVNLQFFPLKKQKMLPHFSLVSHVIASINGAFASLMQAEASSALYGRFARLCFCHCHENMLQMACWSQEDKRTRPQLTTWNQPPRFTHKPARMSKYLRI